MRSDLRDREVWLRRPWRSCSSQSARKRRDLLAARFAAKQSFGAAGARDALVAIGLVRPLLAQERKRSSVPAASGSFWARAQPRRSPSTLGVVVKHKSVPPWRPSGQRASGAGSSRTQEPRFGKSASGSGVEGYRPRKQEPPFPISSPARVHGSLKTRSTPPRLSSS